MATFQRLAVTVLHEFTASFRELTRVRKNCIIRAEDQVEKTVEISGGHASFVHDGKKASIPKSALAHPGVNLAPCGHAYIQPDPICHRALQLPLAVRRALRIVASLRLDFAPDGV